MNYMDDKKTRSLDSNLRLARGFVYRICSTLVDRAFDKKDEDNVDDIDIVMISANNYIEERKTVKNREQIIVKIYNKIIDSVSEGAISQFAVKEYFEPTSHWALTSSSIFERKSAVAITGMNIFHDWIFGHYDRTLEEKNNADISEVIAVLFPLSDAILLANMHWFIFLNLRERNAMKAVQTYLSNPRPFAISTYGYEGDWKSRKDFTEQTEKYAKQSRREAALIVAKMYGSYFIDVLPIEKLIEAADIKQYGYENDEMNIKSDHLKDALIEVQAALRNT
jgi:hypothetical protein